MVNDSHSVSEPVWRARQAQDLVWAEFGSDFVVYHRPSGKTHFLNAATAALLREVLIDPKPARAAAAALAAAENAAEDGDFFAAVAGSLAQLEYLGLVERLDG